MSRENGRLMLTSLDYPNVLPIPETLIVRVLNWEKVLKAAI